MNRTTLFSSMAALAVASLLGGCASMRDHHGHDRAHQCADKKCCGEKGCCGEKKCCGDKAGKGEKGDKSCCAAKGERCGS